MELDEFVCERNLEHFRRLANLSTSLAPPSGKRSSNYLLKKWAS